MRLSLSDDLLLYGDKMSMAASIEARVPFLDLELTKIIEALPAKFRIRGLTQKYILKKMALKYLPKETIYRKKRGFETPIDSWFQGEMSTYIQDKLISPNSIISQYFNIPEVITLIKNHQSRRQNNQRQLFSLISFAIWHSIFIEGNRP